MTTNTYTDHDYRMMALAAGYEDMRKIHNLTAKYLREILDYDPETGVFVWKARDRKHFKTDAAFQEFNRRWAGSEAGHINSRGYRVIKIDYIGYRAHQLAWLHYYGEHPTSDIDHESHARADNSIGNLRLVRGPGNARNQKLYKSNKSGVCGVRYRESRNVWIAQIYIGLKCIQVGRSKDKFEAICARKSAENKYGFHKNHGKKLSCKGACHAEGGR